MESSSHTRPSRTEQDEYSNSTSRANSPARSVASSKISYTSQATQASQISQTSQTTQYSNRTNTTLAPLIRPSDSISASTSASASPTQTLHSQTFHPHNSRTPHPQHSGSQASYKGFPSEAAYLAALSAWAEEKKYITPSEDPHMLEGWYGRQTLEEKVADLEAKDLEDKKDMEGLSGLGVGGEGNGGGLGLMRKWRERRESKARQREGSQVVR